MNFPDLTVKANIYEDDVCVVSSNDKLFDAQVSRIVINRWDGLVNVAFDLVGTSMQF